MEGDNRKVRLTNVQIGIDMVDIDEAGSETELPETEHANDCIDAGEYDSARHESRHCSNFKAIYHEWPSKRFDTAQRHVHSSRRHGGPSQAQMAMICLWVGPLPIPHSKEADQQELLMLLDGLWVHNIELHRQFAYVTVPESQIWDVRVRITNRAIRNGHRLSVRERVDSCNFVPVQVSPLDIVFSQMEIADRFRDDIVLDEVVLQVETCALAEGWSLLAPPLRP